jgi:UDP-N-acetylmuramoyl-tripeptide--D-alanyl-D-alanine ligase
MEGVAEEEGWLGQLLPESGTLFLNGDSEWTPKIADRTRAKTALVGASRENAWRGDLVSMDESGVRFRVAAPREDFSGEYKTNLLGRHQITNAVFALAVGAELGISAEAARRGLALAQPPKMRMQSWQAGGVRVLDDSYNANADSMLAALETLADLPCSGRRIAILGDMAELGEHAESAHREVGRCAAELGINLLIGVGKFATQTAHAAAQAGLRAVLRFDSVETAAANVPDVVQAGDLVLLKASRATGLDRVGQQLRAQFDKKKSL